MFVKNSNTSKKTPIRDINIIFWCLSLSLKSVIYFSDDEQVMEAEKFILNEIVPIGDKYFDDGVGTMDFTYGNTLYFSAWVLR